MLSAGVVNRKGSPHSRWMAIAATASSALVLVVGIYFMRRVVVIYNELREELSEVTVNVATIVGDGEFADGSPGLVPLVNVGPGLVGTTLAGAVGVVAAGFLIDLSLKMEKKASSVDCGGAVNEPV